MEETGTMKRVEKLLWDIGQLKEQQREVEHKLVREIEEFEGTVLDALRIGLVRLNFSAPSGFYQWLRKIK